MVRFEAGLEHDVTGRPSVLSNNPRRRIDPPVAEAVLSRALTRAWWAVLWERLWPPLATLATAIGTFLIVSWAGLWLTLPPIWRAVGVGLFGLIVLASAVPLARLALPRRRDALRRLDLQSGLPHRPATTISDEVAAGTEDKGSLALWQAHMVRSLTAASRLKAGLPQPRLLLRDPYALRGLVLILAIATFIGAGRERLSRVTAAFDWHGAVQAANFRIDAWVTPPTYTGRPPVILPGVRVGEQAREARAMAVPTGSVLVIRATGTHLDLATTGLTEGGPDQGTSRVPAGTEERRFTITEDASVTLRGVANAPTWTFTAIPDRAPTIALTKDPEPQARGSLQLAYKIEDDYGVTFAEAQFELNGAPATNSKTARPLYGAPNFSLALPQARTRNGVGQTIKDLSEHPWAGADVTMTLLARDEAGNEGRSAPHEFKIPQRPFYKPVPKALVEQRQILALDAEARGRVLTAVDALTIAPERFTPETGVYLGLRAIYWLLASAKSDDDLREVVNRLWAMAVQIEDGNISDAEAALRAAQDALRQALERGASEEEIKRLMDQLRAALDKFLQALAEELRKNPQQMARPLDRNMRELRPQDLKSMLDRLENLARSGNKDAARQLLEQLQQMLENLQMARPGQQGDMDDDMMSALDELGDMIRREQQLRDRTFRQGQDSRRERAQRGQRGQRGQERQQGQQGEQGDQQGQQGFDDLRQGQQALREQLKKLLEELRKRGQMMGQGKQPGEQGEDGADSLGRAEQAMRDAEGQLGEGDADGAVDSQGRAIDAMRKGAQGLAQQMGQDGPNGPGPNGRPGRMGQSRANQDTDPLGRPLRGRDLDDGLTVKVPGEIDVQRARRILEELRRRFADPARPQLELDYIERLLKDF
jgi:uncharacterized protein (TIGR02302 family)